MSEQHNERRRVLIGVTVDLSVPFHRDLVRVLADRGCDVHMVSSSGPNLSSLPSTVTSHVLEMSRNPHPLRDLVSLAKWVALLREVRPEAVMVGTPKASLLGIAAAWMCRVPVRIYFCQGLRLETTAGPMRRMLLALERLTARLATSIISVSPSIKARLIELGIGRQSKIAVIGSGSANGVDLARFYPAESNSERYRSRVEWGLVADTFTVGFVGRLTEDKGIKELKEAVLSVHAEGQKVQALLVGPTEDELGEDVVSELQSAGVSVVATGRVSDPSMYLRAMSILCLPSYREGLGNAIIEAQACGVPVVATRVTGIVDVVEHGVNGLLVDARDSDGLADAIRTLMSDPILKARLSDRALELVKRDFDTVHVVSGQSQYILEAIGA